jgi:hypothetical protein
MAKVRRKRKKGKAKRRNSERSGSIYEGKPRHRRL